MAQREQHERVKRMDRLADKLLGHKAVVMAILVVIAMASGLAMANLGGGAGGVSFERTDGSDSLVEPGSGDASSGKTSEGSSSKASAAAEVYVDVDGAVVSPGVYRLKDGARVAQAIDAAGGLAPEADAEVARIDADALRRQVKRWRPWVVMLMAGWFEMRYRQSRDKQFIALADDAWRQLQTKG